MDLPQLIAQARDLRQLFDAAAQRNHRAPWSRLEIAQGFAADVGELQKLCMIADGRRAASAAPPNAPATATAPLAHELADCLWSILILADEYGVDLADAFPRMIAEAQAKLTR